MPISALILHLSSQDDLQAQAFAELAKVRELELGQRDGQRLAAVLDTPNEDVNRRLWRHLNELAGVNHVDVVFVSLDQQGEQPTRSPERMSVP